MGTVPTVRATVKVRTQTNANVRVNLTISLGQARLTFGRGNSKLDDGIWTFSLPAGHACPFADRCQSRADPKTGHISDGPNTEFRCFAASGESRAPSVRKSRWHNFELLRRCRSSAEMARLILASLSPFAGFVRVHVSGDFWSQAYLDAWLLVAKQRPRTTFYWYTKSLRYWVARIDQIGDGHTGGSLLNVVATASLGGRDDDLIERHGLRDARVVYSKAEAARLVLDIDHDDSYAMAYGPSFALLLHGTQPPGSEASKALRELWRSGEFGHGERADQIRQGGGRLPLQMAT
jgi:hypothetical protein